MRKAPRRLLRSQEEKVRGPGTDDRRELARKSPAGAALALAVWCALATVVFARFAFFDRGGFAEEAIPFRQAFVLWGWGETPATLNPHFFSYPSFSIYAHWLVQWTAGAMGVLTGRYQNLSDAGVEFALAPTYLVSAARFSMFLSLALTAWLGYSWWAGRSRWMGGWVAVLLCTSPLLTRSALQLTPEILMCPGVLLVLLLLRRERSASAARRALCCLVAGAVCGIKYSALPLSLVCVVVLAGRETGLARRLRHAVLLAALVVLGFTLTTPFAVLAWPEFRAGVVFELRHLAEGHLGGTRAQTLAAHMVQLWDAGGVALVAALVGGVAFPRTMSRNAILALIGAATFALPAMGARSGGPERYLVPCIPMLWVYVSECARALMGHGVRASRVVGVICIVGGGATIVQQARSVITGPTASPVAGASEWVRTHARPDDVIVSDHGALATFSVEDQASLMNSRCLAGASPEWQRRARTALAHNIVTIPFMAAGKIGATVSMGDGTSREVDVFDPAWNLVPAFHEALQDVPVQYIVTSESIQGRLRTELARGTPPRSLHVPLGPEVFPAETTAARRGHANAVRVYRAAEAPSESPQLAAGWWFAHAQPASRNGAPPIPGALMDVARGRVYLQRVRPFLLALAVGELKRGDFAAAANAARLLVMSDPTDVVAARIALVAVADGDRGVIQARDGTSAIRRSHSEPLQQWLSRVLAAWGVAEATASDEVARFLAWKRPLPPSGPWRPGRGRV